MLAYLILADICNSRSESILNGSNTSLMFSLIQVQCFFFKVENATVLCERYLIVLCCETEGRVMLAQLAHDRLIHDGILVAEVSTRTQVKRNT